MRRYRVIKDPDTGESYVPVSAMGADLYGIPTLNKGTAFPLDEREAFGLRGILPPHVSSMEEQLERVYAAFSDKRDDLAKFLFLIALQDRNETLYYRLLLEHLEEMAPIVYTPTVGDACEQFSHIYRRPRGIYVTRNDRGRIREIMNHAPYEGVAVIVATDGEGILGIGDQGAGGIEIAIGKLTLYTCGAGIHPARCLPVMLDVGTNNAKMLNDPLYLGVREPRLQDDEYLEFMDEFVDAVFSTYPDVLLQWEDFSRQKAWSVLERFRDRTCSFNDDIQGTGAVTYAGILAACKLTGTPIQDQSFCVYGAGAGGGGIIEVIVSALQKAGLSEHEARQRVVALDSRGLILTDRQRLEPFKRVFAREPEIANGWDLSDSHKIGLLDTVTNFKPTMLIGTSGQPGTFTEAIVREMAGYAERPGIFALSNPTSKTEVLPENVFKWTDGRGLVATGSPFPPVVFNGKAHGIGQGNNAFCFPGIGLGVYASGATRVTRQMLLAAGEAVAEHVSDAQLAEGQIYPSVENLRAVSRSVAISVGMAALASGVIPDGDAEGLTLEVMAERVDEKAWYPEYIPYRRAE